jgi:hypothetical protein
MAVAGNHCLSRASNISNHFHLEKKEQGNDLVEYHDIFFAMVAKTNMKITSRNFVQQRLCVFSAHLPTPEPSADPKSAGFIDERRLLMHMTDRGEEVVRPTDPNAAGGMSANAMGASQAVSAAAALGAKNPFARAAAELARDSSFSGSGSDAKGVGAGSASASAGGVEDEEEDDDDDSDPPPPPGTETISGAHASQSNQS